MNFTSGNTTDRDRQAFAFLQTEFGLSGRLVEETFEFQVDKVWQTLAAVLVGDAKGLGGDHRVVVYQVPSWGLDVKQKESQILAAVKSSDAKLGCDWSVLNIFDLTANESFIFCRSLTGQKVIGQALGTSFAGNWALIAPRILRKGIIPKLKKILDESF